MFLGWKNERMDNHSIFLGTISMSMRFIIISKFWVKLLKKEWRSWTNAEVNLMTGHISIYNLFLMNTKKSTAKINFQYWQVQNFNLCFFGTLKRTVTMKIIQGFLISTSICLQKDAISFSCTAISQLNLIKDNCWQQGKLICWM